MSRKKKRREEFARVQDLFRRSRGTCAREILDGAPVYEVEDPVQFLDCWQGMMAPSAPDFSEPEEPAPECTYSEITKPITDEDVK